MTVELLSLEQAKQYIFGMDFSSMLDKMVNQQGWLRKDAEKICEYYRNFLYLNRKYGGDKPLPPSEEVDEFWHNHILDTRRYHQDCQKIFGRYFHHYPYFGLDAHSTMKDVDNAFDRVQALHKQEFGEEIYVVRSLLSKPVSLFKKLKWNCFHR